MTYYNPDLSQIEDCKIQEFINLKITGDLLEVPGIQEDTKNKLNKKGIKTTFNLIGKFLSLNEPQFDNYDHCDKFYLWLFNIGVTSYTVDIVKSISEKCNTIFPRMYDFTIKKVYETNCNLS